MARSSPFRARCPAAGSSKSEAGSQLTPKRRPAQIPYRVHPADPEKTLRPYLRIAVPIQEQWVATLGIIDSGADYSMFPMQLAVDIGLKYDQNDPKDMLGVGGLTPKGAFVAVDGLIIRSEIGEITLRQPWLVPSLPIILLGRSDFFAAFRVDFGRNIITITRN